METQTKVAQDQNLEEKNNENTTSNTENGGQETPPVKKEKEKITPRGIAGGTMLTFGVISILAILFITFKFFTGDIEIIAAFFSITALLILTSVLMFFGNIVLTINEKEKDAKKKS